jgi:hypothetical protein
LGQERTSALLLQLQDLDLGIGADAAIKMIFDRLAKAQLTEAKANLAEERSGTAIYTLRNEGGVMR